MRGGRIYEPLEYYRRLYDSARRTHSFRARSVEEWREWRDGLRGKLSELLGLDYPSCSLDPETVEVREFPGYLREKVVFQADEYTTIPAYVLKPSGAEGRMPAVLALHGHGYGKDEIVGIWEDGEERVDPVSRGYSKDFALELVKRGLLVVAIDQAGFGERREPEDAALGPRSSSCWRLSTWALLLGKTAVGRRVWDAMRTIDYLETRPDVDAGRMGAMGISGGGTTALFTAALDDRIKATVVSGYLSTFRDSILSMQHCIDNYIPGILRHAEMYDVAALIAPRPLFVESGTKDPIFPISAARRAYERVREAYRLLGAEERLEADFFEGVHEVCGRRSYDFLARWLGSGG